jgi:hypothetical protein
MQASIHPISLSDKSAENGATAMLGLNPVSLRSLMRKYDIRRYYPKTH